MPGLPESTEPLPAFDLNAIDKHFPMKVNGEPSYREGQKEAIEFIVKAFNSGKKIAILEGPVGSGKSPIGMALADMVDKSYYLTATKILQDQLVAEFDDVVELKGRNAYPCTLYQRFGAEMVKRGIMRQQELTATMAKDPSCGEGFCKTKRGKTQGSQNQRCLKCFTHDGPNGNRRPPTGDLHHLPTGMTYSACPYYEQVYQAINGRKVVMNFSSFLFQTQMTKRFGMARDLLIIDEAHNVESQLMDFIGLTISDSYLKQFNIVIPQLETALEYVAFFEDIELVKTIGKAIEDAIKSDQVWLQDELARVLRKYRTFVEHVRDTEAEWVAEYEVVKATGSRKVTLKPVQVYGMAKELLFKHAKHVLLMSATILDVGVMCRSLGIKREDVAALRMKNRFPAANRPIYLQTIGKLTGGKNNMSAWGPPLVEKVDELVRKYPNQRGIIHTHNFAIQEMLKSRCAADVSVRFTLQQNFKDKSVMLRAHAAKADSIIVAPAMHEGLNLVEDLSRLQIICKVPYPNCFDDAQLARRVEIDQRYYTWLTALKLVQSYGRSVRSETDQADTYILDESIYRFLREAGPMLPVWFTEAIIDG